jgi:uncharacterized protein (DUF1800 family)
VFDDSKATEEMKSNTRPRFGTIYAVFCAATLVVQAAMAAPDDKLSGDDARHFLNRTGFAASLTEIDAYTGLTRGQAAEKVVAAARDVAVTPPPSWV